MTEILKELKRSDPAPTPRKITKQRVRLFTFKEQPTDPKGASKSPDPRIREQASDHHVPDYFNFAGLRLHACETWRGLPRVG